MEIYAPIAHRLGMGKIRGELEDLAFRYLEPEAYAEILAAIESKRARRTKSSSTRSGRRSKPSCGAKAFRRASKARVKRAYSVFQKLKRQKITLDQVYDLLALRIITDSVKNCYAALGVIHNEWRPIPGPHQGFHRHSAAEPVPVAAHLRDRARTGSTFEVQIRTEEMHRIAEEGIAAHWKYKEGTQGPGRRRSAHRLAAPAGRVAARHAGSRASSCPR